MARERPGEPDRWLRDLQAATTGSVRVQLSPEVFVDFPVEVFDHRGPGYVSAETLGISQPLEVDLTRWLRWWQDRVGFGDEGGEDEEMDADEWRQWNEDGARLLERLKDELGPGFEVHQV